MSVNSYSSEEGSDSENEGIVAIQHSLENLSKVIGVMLPEIDALESELKKLERPLEQIVLEQFGDIPYLASSPFRKERFLFQPPGFPGINLTIRYEFREICDLLRTYLLKNSLMNSDEEITVSPLLKSIFKINTSKTTYLELIGHLRNVLV